MVGGHDQANYVRRPTDDAKFEIEKETLKE